MRIGPPRCAGGSTRVRSFTTVIPVNSTSFPVSLPARRSADTGPSFCRTISCPATMPILGSWTFSPKMFFPSRISGDTLTVNSFPSRRTVMESSLPAPSPPPPHLPQTRLVGNRPAPQRFRNVVAVALPDELHVPAERYRRDEVFRLPPPDPEQLRPAT